MTISSNSLFHFTNSLKSLTGILSFGFKLTYCKEKYYLAKELYDSNYPMICFCDIPLNLAQNHIKRYGSYAIGMTKEWAILHNLNPVVYVEKNSLLARDILATTDDMGDLIAANQEQLNRLGVMSRKFAEEVEEVTKGFPENSSEYKISAIKKVLENKDKLIHVMESVEGFKKLSRKYPKIIQNTFSVFGYIKNYEGNLERQGKITRNYRFYDEREWRYVPALGHGIANQLNENEYKKYRGVDREKPFIKDIGLTFASKDIRYLIVKSSEDVPKLLKAIRSINNLTTNPNDADILSTKILTVEQLQRDF